MAKYFKMMVHEGATDDLPPLNPPLQSWFPNENIISNEIFTACRIVVGLSGVFLLMGFMVEGWPEVLEKVHTTLHNDLVDPFMRLPFTPRRQTKINKFEYDFISFAFFHRSYLLLSSFDRSSHSSNEDWSQFIYFSLCVGEDSSEPRRQWKNQTQMEIKIKNWKTRNWMENYEIAKEENDKNIQNPILKQIKIQFLFRIISCEKVGELSWWLKFILTICRS